MKYLQANLKTLFKPYTPKLPAIKLPSGPLYTPRITLHCMNKITLYTIETKSYFSNNGLSIESIVVPVLKKLSDNTLLLTSTPIPPKKPIITYTKYGYFTIDDIKLQKYYRTEDDAYIQLFLSHSNQKQEYSEKYRKILNKYPEYFI